MRIVSADEAVAGIQSGEQIFVHGGAATPSALLEALVRRAGELEDVSLVHFHTEGPGPHLAPEMAGHLRHKALFIGRNARQAVNEGRADYVPVFLSDVPDLFRNGIIPLDAVFLNVTPPDAHGFCSLGTSVDASLAAARSAKRLIVQLNRSMPRTHGDTFIHTSKIDLAVEVECRDLEEVAYALGIGADVLLLDNMDAETLRKAVSLRDENAGGGKGPSLEASGGVTLETVREIAETGVDFISVGALTHSAPTLDFSLMLEAAT